MLALSQAESTQAQRPTNVIFSAIAPASRFFRLRRVFSALLLVHGGRLVEDSSYPSILRAVFLEH